MVYIIYVYIIALLLYFMFSYRNVVDIIFYIICIDMHIIINTLYNIPYILLSAMLQATLQRRFSMLAHTTLLRRLV